MCRPIAAVLIAVAMLISACGLRLPDQINLPPELTGGEPQTLDAATKAAQEYVDRRSAQDLAGVWLMYTEDVRNAISQQDYVRLNTTCRNSLEGIPPKVVGVRMDGSEHAVIRVSALGSQVTYDMVYQDGKWLVAPNDRLRAELSKPVDTIIAERKAAGRCGNQEVFFSSSPTTTTTALPTSTDTASTSDVSGASTGGTGKLVAVRLGPKDGYDRLVFEFADGVPRYKIGYRPLPVPAGPSGDEIPLPGANALVWITLSGATGAGWGGGQRTYFGPSTLTADTTVVTEAHVRGHEKVPTGGQVEVPGFGQMKVPTLCSSC